MPPDPSPYKQLQGQGRGLGWLGLAQASLWVGPDHLLYALNEGYAEYYRRFYFRDIQAIMLRKTSAGAWWNVVWITLMALTTPWLFLGLQQHRHPALIITLAVFIALCLAALLINIAKGPTCITVIRTAVQRQRIDSLRRLSVTMKAIAQLREIIENAQGRLDPAELEQVIREAAATDPLPPSSPASPATTNQPRQKPRRLKPCTGRIHTWLFAFLLADFFHHGFQFFLTHANMYYLTASFTVAILVCSLIAVIKQLGTTLPVSVKTLTWLTLLYLVIDNVLTKAGLTFFTIQNFATWQGPMNPHKALHGVGPFDSSIRMGLILLHLLGSGLLGSLGLTRLRAFRWRPTQPLETSHPESTLKEHQ